MAKRPSRPRDPMQLAKLIGDIATGQAAPDQPIPAETPATQARRKGGLKGGKARAKKLSAKKRRSFATNAAKSRWNQR